jgi:hypothetical protein
LTLNRESSTLLLEPRVIQFDDQQVPNTDIILSSAASAYSAKRLQAINVAISWPPTIAQTDGLKYPHTQVERK